MPIYTTNKPKVPGAPTSPSVQRYSGALNFNKPSGTTYTQTKGGVKSQSPGSSVFTPQRVIDRAKAATAQQQQAKAQQQAQQAAAQNAAAQAQAAQQVQRTFNPDAVYNAAMARLGFDRDTGLAELQRQQGYAQVDFDENLRRLNAQRPEDERRVREGANDEGLFYSGQLGKRQGDLATEYARQEGDLRRDKERADAEIAAAIKAINDRYALDQSEQQQANLQRQIEADAAAAAAGALAGPVAPSPDVVARQPKKNRWADAFQRNGHWWYRNENGVAVKLR